MAVVSTVEAVRANMLLNNGVDAQGNVKTVTVSLGTLNASAWDAQKALTIANSIEACLAKTISKFQKVETTTIREE